MFVFLGSLFPGYPPSYLLQCCCYLSLERFFLSDDSDFPGVGILGSQGIFRSGHILERKCPCLWLGWGMGWRSQHSVSTLSFKLPVSSTFPLLSTVPASSCGRPYFLLSVLLSPGLCGESSVWSGGGHQTSNCFQNRLSRDLFSDPLHAYLLRYQVSTSP